MRGEVQGKGTQGGGTQVGEHTNEYTRERPRRRPKGGGQGWIAQIGGVKEGAQGEGTEEVQVGCQIA